MGDYNYSVELVKFARLNKDGTMPTPKDWTHTDKNGVTQNHSGGIVGGAGPFNLTALLTVNKAKLKVSLNGIVEEKDIDFTAAVSKGAVTVDEAVTAINGANFATNTLTASKTAAGNLKIVSTKALVEEFEDFEIIAASDTKGLHKALGVDIEWIAAKDVKSVKFDPETETGSSVKLDGGRGTVAEVKEPDTVKDIKITFQDTEDNPAVEVIVAGFDYDAATGRTFPPAMNAVNSGFACKAFAKLFAAGTSQKTSYTAVKASVFPNCQGIFGSAENAAGAWNAPTYTATAVDSAASNLPSFFKRKLTTGQFALVQEV